MKRTAQFLSCTATALIVLPSTTTAFAPSAFGVRSSPGSSSQQQQPQFRSLNSSPLFVSSVEEAMNNGPLNNSDVDSEQSSSSSLSTTLETSASTSIEQLQASSQTKTFAVDDVSAAMNTAVVGGLALAAAWLLFHEKVEALLALYEYGLGPHNPAEISMLGVSMELLGRLPVDAIQAYEELVPTNPIFYKACTSGVAYGLGDFVSQQLQGKTIRNFDLPRSLRSGAAGFIAHGPLCHYWLLTMETYLDFDGAWWATGLKVTADLTVWSIFLNAAYSTIIGVLAGKSPATVMEDMKQTAWPSLRSAWRFWPFVHTISFSHAVPLDLKLLWVDVMEVVWVTILSKVNNEDKAAALAEAQEDSVAALSAASTTMELEATEDKKEEPSFVDTVKPKIAQAWAAGWPLVAMWPVLYAGFQVEHALGLV